MLLTHKRQCTIMELFTNNHRINKMLHGAPQAVTPTAGTEDTGSAMKVSQSLPYVSMAANTTSSRSNVKILNFKIFLERWLQYKCSLSPFLERLQSQSFA